MKFMKRPTSPVVASAIGAALMFCLAVFSCVSPAPAAPPRFSMPPSPYAFIDELALEPGQVYARDMVSSSEGYYPVSAFSAANDFLAMDNWLEFGTKLNETQQLALVTALFKNLPVRTNKGDVRVVVVGDYFGEGSDLFILVDLVGLIPGKVPGHDFALRFITNAFKFRTTDKATGVTSLNSSGSTLNTDLNYARVGISCANGDLVLSGNLTLAPVTLESAKDDSELGNLMDTVLKDEYADNDGLALAAYKTLKSRSALDPMVNLLAEMNYFLYLLKQGAYAEANTVMAALPSLIPADADQELSATVNREPGFLLRLAQAYDASPLILSE